MLAVGLQDCADRAQDGKGVAITTTRQHFQDDLAGYVFGILIRVGHCRVIGSNPQPVVNDAPDDWAGVFRDEMCRQMFRFCLICRLKIRQTSVSLSWTCPGESLGG